MGSPTATPASDGANSRVCLAAACVITVAWFLFYNHSRPDYLVDEPGHLGNIYHFLEGKAGWPEAMPMLPGYHFIVAGLWQLHPPCKLLTLARLVSTICTLVGLAAFALAWRRWHGTPAGPSTLLFALLPVWQPFTGMAYTDAPALSFVLAAWAMHLAGHRATAAGILLGAVCLRQTALVWAAFFVAWEILRARATGADGLRGFVRHVWPGIRWPLALLLLAAAVALAAGRFTVGTSHGNPATFNPAQLHFAGILLLGLGLPLWLGAARRLPRWFLLHLRARPARTLGLTAAFLAVAAALGLTFANPHEWNRALSWDGCSFTLLRNWPLVGIERYPWLRFVSALNLAALAVAAIVWVRCQPDARVFACAAACGVAPVAVSSLVEPRYFLPALVFGLFFARLSRRATVVLGCWWGALAALHAPLVAAGRSLW